MDNISALMDGELDERQTALELGRLRQSTELRQAWNTFHIIGDVLRGERALSTDIVGNFSRKLADEPTVLAPQRQPRRVTTYVLSAAASLAAVGFVGWVALTPQSPTESVASHQVPVVAPVPVAPVVVTPVVSMPDEGRRSEYLLAHQGFSPSTAIQGVVPYIRSVSARQSAQGR